MLLISAAIAPAEEPTAGLEPATSRLQGESSADLSYVGAPDIIPYSC
jgi:hypothetical protein